MSFVCARGRHVTLSHLACNLPLGHHPGTVSLLTHPELLTPNLYGPLLAAVPLLWQMLGWKSLWQPSICYYQPGIDVNPPLLAKYKNIDYVCPLSIWSLPSFLPNLTLFHTSEPTLIQLLTLTLSMSDWTYIVLRVCHCQSSLRRSFVSPSLRKIDSCCI